MIALFQSMPPEASHDAGIWRLPNGEAIYARTCDPTPQPSTRPMRFTPLVSQSGSD